MCAGPIDPARAGAPCDDPLRAGASLPTQAELREIAMQFDVDPPVGLVCPLGKGLINDTFALETGGGCYVLQRLNATVFPDPGRIIANLQVLTDQAARRPDAGLRVPGLIPARNGAGCVRDASGGVWRLMERIAEAITHARIRGPDQARQVGRVLGRFHRLVADLPTERLAIALPGFHDTPRYLERLQDRVDRCRPRDLAPEVQRAIAFVSERAGLVQVLDRAWRDGRIARRITHGDPKLDNILFDRRTGEALALIDLDTVQPGLLQHDLGDCLRSCCNRRGEGAEPWRAHFDLSIGAAILDGYASVMRALLTAADVDLLYEATRLMPLELGLRFLTDHLEGDRYFRISEPGQNLRKALTQFSLVADVERQEREIRASVAACFSPNRGAGTAKAQRTRSGAQG